MGIKHKVLFSQCEVYELVGDEQSRELSGSKKGILDSIECWEDRNAA